MTVLTRPSRNILSKDKNDILIPVKMIPEMKLFPKGH